MRRLWYKAKKFLLVAGFLASAGLCFSWIWYIPEGWEILFVTAACLLGANNAYKLFS